MAAWPVSADSYMAARADSDKLPRSLANRRAHGDAQTREALFPVTTRARQVVSLTYNGVAGDQPTADPNHA